MHQGFLPVQDPLKKLPKAFEAFEKVAAHLPKLLVTTHFKSVVTNLPPFPLHELDPAQYERAMMILSYLGHAWVWGSPVPSTVIPHVLAKPWSEVAGRLQRPPVLSYASYALNNWYRLDPEQPVALGNIALTQNFLGGVDEEWFILVHVDIEAKAASAIAELTAAQKSAEEKNQDKLQKNLLKIAGSLEEVCKTMDRMPERCDPYIYYNRVRPYIHGWKNNPALPDGLVYEGMFDEVPQFFRGETGAQSTIVPSLDAVLGVTHEKDELRVYLQEMREYMPAEHRQFLEKLESRAAIREFVAASKKQHPDLADIYNRCIDLLYRFRTTHLNYAARYIHKQAEQSIVNSNAVGTGGTPFMKYLKKHEAETAKFRV